MVGKYRRRMRPLLGTYVEIGLSRAFQNCDRTIERAFERIETVQKHLSFHDPRSDLSRLNSARGEEIAVHPMSICALRLARVITWRSKGLFNFTVGAQLQKIGALPIHESGKKLMAGHADDLEIRGQKIRLRRPLVITLDGIAKGFAVDLAVKELKAHGANLGWVNAGGDLRVFGDLTLPMFQRSTSRPDGKIPLLGGLRNSALATSETSETSDTSDSDSSQFPGKIIAACGHSAEGGIWSVIAPSAWLADALTKVAGVSSQRDREFAVSRLGGHLIQGADSEVK
ncbi:MAG: FAD:protein FMN transferase [Bdellovibrionales bacterium]|nr:FAD:protein FMN transferase [Bdellovibrionales bacterium]